MRFLFKLIVIVLIGALCFVGYYSYEQMKKEQDIAEKIDDYNKVLKQIREEKTKLQNEAKIIYENLYLPNMGSTYVLLSDTRIEQLDDAISTMEDYGYHGLLALSPYCMPEDNKEGYMTSEDVDRLIEDGYELVIKLNNEDIEKTYKNFIDKGYDIKGIYFENTSVSKTKIENIKKINPDLAIIGNFEESTNYSDMLLITLYGSKQNGVKTAYENSIGTSESIALAVGYENTRNQYTYDNFVAMIKLIRSHIDENETDLCNISEGRVRYDEYKIAIQEELPEQISRLDQINSSLESIEKQISGYKE